MSYLSSAFQQIEQAVLGMEIANTNVNNFSYCITFINLLTYPIHSKEDIQELERDKEVDVKISANLSSESFSFSISEDQFSFFSFKY
ncbi:hypothetical protein T4D_4912 [Trichinella pseudospiralis]|uniref:Uncharacterized protein n=1 Tax=Trichinella pseudospiralis TaxID=6337 RepID=A0A0V1FU87_TRIPS|nr:hypothetical protein T4D_4912 [Trichinella pseudospiralis]